MSPERLGALAARWRARWTIAVGIATVAAALFTYATARRLGGSAGTAALGGIVVAALAAAVALRRRPAVDARAVARYLDRVTPALEDSAELLATDDAALTPLARLQRARVERVLAGLPEPSLPHTPWRRSVRIAAALLAAGAAVAAWPAGPDAVSTATPPSPSPGAPPVPAIGAIAVTVQPPAYTGRRARTYDDGDAVDIEEGARATWRIGLTGLVTAAAIVTTAGDSAALRDGRATLVVGRSFLYRALAAGPGGTVASPYHRLLVTPDQPPVVTVVRPEPRTVVPTGAPAHIALEALANDDYGVRDAWLVATLTTGRGEGVTFRERRVAFDQRAARRGGGLVLRADLDLDALGMGPGDELYLHVVARDGRAPEPNESRSETYIVTRADTATVTVADFSGLAIGVLPEYFRSQRQIIIDTERLLADRGRLTRAEHDARSQNIGLDQHALRLRYGEIVGDETAEDPAALDPTAAHEHDVEENATRLAGSVKRTLQAALAQMWEAEVRLRTNDPRGALPHEYRALELLKEVQQSARAYVQRVGFAPPPLEPDRDRLTGELDDIADREASSARPRRDSLPAVRAALRALDDAAPAAATLEAAGRELAPLAVADPARHLATLGALRDLVTALARGSDCAACRERARRGLWAALPAPGPEATAGGQGTGGVARTYFELLERVP